MIYVLSSELLRMESLPFAAHLQKIALYSMMPWKRRLDKAVMYLESAMAVKERGSGRIIRLLDKAAAQMCKSMMPEIFAKRSQHCLNALR